MVGKLNGIGVSGMKRKSKESFFVLGGLELMKIAVFPTLAITLVMALIYTFIEMLTK